MIIIIISSCCENDENIAQIQKKKKNPTEKLMD